MNNILRYKFQPRDYLRYLAYLLLFLPVFGFRDFLPPNELKYISIIEEALRNNTWFTFYNHGEIYADKPPLFFWLLMLVKLVSGSHSMWLIGIICLLPGIGTLAVMDRWMQRFSQNHDKLGSNVMLLTTTMFTGSLLVIRMDMMMTFFITLSLYTFFKIYSGQHKRRDIWLFPFYIFMAVFSKGPVGFIVPLVTVTAFLIYKRQIRSFFRYFGWRQWLVMLGLCVIWFSCIYLEGGSEYLHNLTVKQTVGRGIDSFHHKEPIWFYLAHIPFSFAPWTLLFLIVIVTGIRRKLFNTDTERFFATAIITTFVMLSLVSAKLDIYLLPVYPFVAYLCSALLAKCRDNGWIKAGVAVPAVALACAPTIFIVAKSHIKDFDITPVLPYISTAIMSVGGLCALWLTFKRSTRKGAVAMGVSIILAVFVLSFDLPAYNKYIGFEQMAKSAKNKAESEGIKHFVHHRFYTGENMDVFLGQELERVNTLPELDSLDKLPERRIVFIREKYPKRDAELREFLSDKEKGWSTSQYSWVILGGRDEAETTDLIVTIP